MMTRCVPVTGFAHYVLFYAAARKSLEALAGDRSLSGAREDTYYGHLVLRLMGCLVLFYTSRVICKGRLTMEEIIFSLKHSWRFVDLEVLE